MHFSLKFDRTYVTLFLIYIGLIYK